MGAFRNGNKLHVDPRTVLFPETARTQISDRAYNSGAPARFMSSVQFSRQSLDTSCRDTEHSSVYYGLFDSKKRKLSDVLHTHLHRNTLHRDSNRLPPSPRTRLSPSDTSSRSSSIFGFSLGNLVKFVSCSLALNGSRSGKSPGARLCCFITDRNTVPSSNSITVHDE